MNSAQENPLFDVDGDQVIHHGAFYQAALSLELDGATLALALTAPITHSRIRMLNDPETNGGNAFLAADSDGSSGLMMVEYVAAGAIAEIRNAAQPASVGTLVLSRGPRRTPPSPPRASSNWSGRSPPTACCSAANWSAR